MGGGDLLKHLHVWSLLTQRYLYGYDLELIIFQVIFRCLKTILFFYTKMKILHCSKVLIFIFIMTPLSVRDLCAFLCIVSLGMSYLAIAAILLLSMLAYSCVFS